MAAGLSSALSRFSRMKSHPIFLARCVACDSSFSRPELSDQEYGAVILSTSDGAHHAYVTAFDEFPKRVSNLIKNDIWQKLARLADPINGRILVSERPCPHCGSTNLKSWSGEKTGETKINLVTFALAEKLSDDQLRKRIETELTW